MGQVQLVVKEQVNRPQRPPLFKVCLLAGLQIDFQTVLIVIIVPAHAEMFPIYLQTPLISSLY